MMTTRNEFTLNNKNIDHIFNIYNQLTSSVQHKIKERQNLNKDEIINSFKPPIFWKEKVIVKKQMSEWSEEEIKNKIFKLADLEILVKSNNSGINLVSDFVNNY